MLIVYSPWPNLIYFIFELKCLLRFMEYKALNV